MQIHIHSVGGKFEPFYLDAIEEYKKRLSRYCKIKLHHHKATDTIMKKLQPSHIIVVKKKDKTVSSEGLADMMNQLAITGKSKISFILSPYPIDVDADQVISMTPMDMDMGLLTTIMYEQIYRGFRIIRGEPYHK